jgi:colanic acid/amylovoran biosynthesis protein
VTKILLANIHSSRNAGDAALMLATLQQLRQNFPKCNITLIMDDPDESQDDAIVVESIFTWVKSTSKGGYGSWRLGNLLLLPISTLLPVLTYRLFGKPLYILTPSKLRVTIQAYLNTDMAVSSPGGFLYSSGSGLVLVIMIYTLALLWLAGKPFYIFPQSFGPLSHRWEGGLLCWLLSKARIVMVRETISMELLNQYHLQHPRLYLLPDIAFTFPGGFPEVAVNWLLEHGIDPSKENSLLGLTVINWSAQNPNFNKQTEYEIACAGAIRFFVTQLGGKAILFPQVTGPTEANDDRIPARRIFSRLSDISDSILLVEQQLPPELIKALYGHLDVLIGTRMHSVILALSEGVPVIAIGYMHKTQGLANMVGMDRWVLDISKISQDVLVDKLTELWNGRMAVRDQISGSLPVLKEKANLAGKLCAEDYTLLMKTKPHG